MPKVFNVVAEVHKPVGLGYRVKVSLLDLGMYINGVMVLPPDDEHDWSVYPPAFSRAGRGKWKYSVEFNKQMPLWGEIYETCVDIVKLEKTNNADDDTYAVIKQPIQKDEVITDFSDEPINLDDIEF